MTIGAILSVFVLLRLPLLTKEAAVRGWNGDSAIFGLMAKKIHDGTGFDIFFWGQNYMGPLTPTLAAAIRRAVLDPVGVGAEGGPIALRLASMSEIAFGICLSVLGLTRLFGLAIGAAAGLWMAIGPPFFIRLSAVHKGGLGPEMSFALGSVLFFLAAGALTQPRPFLDRATGRFVFALLAGLGWWMNQTIVFVLLPVAALVLSRSAPFREFLRARLGRKVGPPAESLSPSWRDWARLAVPLFCGAALGYLPVWIGRLLGWYEPALGPVVKPWRLTGIPERLFRFFAVDSWRLVGLDGLLPAPLLAAAALVPVSILFLRRARRPGGWLGMEEARSRGLELVGAIAGIAAAVSVFKDLDPAGDRYLTPALPAALALLVVSFAEAAKGLLRVAPAALVALASGGLALLVAVHLAREARAAVEGILRESDPRAPLRAIAEGGYTICHAGYDVAYTLQFLSDERVRFIPFHSPDRNRALSARLRAIPGPQCLVAEDGTVRPWLPSDAAQEGGPARRLAERRR